MRHTAVFKFVLVVVFMPASLLASAQTSSREQQSRPTTPQAPTQRQDAPTPREADTDASADASADVSITAHVTADSLRFEKVPNPRVEFTGQPKRETAWESEREHLPQEVRPGETYRNIGITLHIRSVFADIDRIVAEALGEVPPSDDAPRTPAQPQSPGTNIPQAEPTTLPAQAPANAAATTRLRRGAARRGRGN